MTSIGPIFTNIRVYDILQRDRLMTNGDAVAIQVFDLHPQYTLKVMYDAANEVFICATYLGVSASMHAQSFEHLTPTFTVFGRTLEEVWDSLIHHIEARIL